MNIIRFLKDWTLPVSITMGTLCYLTFYYVPQLDALGDSLAPVFDVIFPLFVFLTLFVTFCKVDFHQMRPHRWHVGVLVAQLLLVAVNIVVIFMVEADVEQGFSSSRFMRISVTTRSIPPNLANEYFFIAYMLFLCYLEIAQPMGQLCH